MDTEPETEYGRVPFIRSAGKTAIRRLAAVLGFLYGMEVISGKMGGYKCAMPVGGLSSNRHQENKKR
jgi:hypothetical protein